MNIISGLYNEGQIRVGIVATRFNEVVVSLSLIHISEPTRRTPISYAVFCLKKKKVALVISILSYKHIIELKNSYT